MYTYEHKYRLGDEQKLSSQMAADSPSAHCRGIKRGSSTVQTFNPLHIAFFRFSFRLIFYSIYSFLHCASRFLSHFFCKEAFQAGHHAVACFSALSHSGGFQNEGKLELVAYL